MSKKNVTKVAIWKRAILVVASQPIAILAIFGFISAKGADMPYLIYAVAMFLAILSAWLLFVGLFGNHKQVKKALCGIDKGITAGI